MQNNKNKIGDVMENIEEFNRKKDILIRNRESALQGVEKAKEKYRKIEIDDTIDKKELRLEVAKKNNSIERICIRVNRESTGILKTIKSRRYGIQIKTI